MISEGFRLVKMHSDGTNPVTLLSDPAGWIPAVERCGKDFLTVMWYFHGADNDMGPWLTKLDGSRPTQFASRSAVMFWNCSPDGKSIYYSDPANPIGFQKLSSAGGQPEPVPGTPFPNSLEVASALSPEGKTLAVFLERETPESQTYGNVIALLNLEKNSPESVRYLSVGGESRSSPSFNDSFHFSPDGKALVFVISHPGIDNVWMQPVNGSQGRQITNFNSQQIRGFDWSPDGKQLAVLRAETDSDVIFLHDNSAPPQ